MFKNILVHYHEIALKGKNRVIFEQKLVDNIKFALRDLPVKSINRLTGRILIELDGGADKDMHLLGNVFGISSYSPILIVKTDLREMKKAVTKVLNFTKGKKFKVETKRNYKKFSKTSMEISSELGAHVLKNSKLQVDIKRPDFKINLEVLKNQTFVYVEKNKGAGGLPVGSSGKMLTLISGGIDSPVASYFMMKRGSSLDFVHFHSYPYTDKASVDKVKEIIRLLGKFQKKSKLFLVPIIDFQKEIVKKTDARYRVVMYRRLMYKIAERLAQKEDLKALVSGDNLGQVASQTIENMSVVQNGIDMPIMRPLVGFDKEDIIDTAKRIGTFATSIEPHGDCCSIFLPKHPATRARLENILEQEKKIGMGKWVAKLSKKIEIIK